ncbi:MAG: TonB-dependent receptor domain-containing protein [Spirosomataceae bacterium]
MKKLFVLFCLSLLATVPSVAQMGAPAAATTTGYGKITGQIIDSTSNEPVEFATVALFAKNDTKKPIDGTISDEKGQFTLKNVPTGQFLLKVSFIGYEDTWVALPALKDNALNLKKVLLSTSAKQLAEVTVTAQKAVIEEKVDRLVYNADKDLSSKGGDATEILRKVPLLTVDIEGNVSLRGNSNIRVLINNKPSTIIASSIADALKQIPADQIKTVEVITSPSAKYDAEGSGGIINIITKKNNLEGMTLNVDAGVGNRASNLGLFGSYRQGKMGFNLSGFGRAFYNGSLLDMEQVTRQGANEVKTVQKADAQDTGAFGRYSLGWDYDITKSQSLAAGVRYGTRNFIRTQDLTINSFLNNNPINSIAREVNTRDLSGNWDFNLDYVNIIKPGKEWTISSLYSRTGLTNNFTSALLNASGETLNRQRNENFNTNQEFTIQTDYTTPISKNQIFETGIKGIFRWVNSDFSYLAASGNSTNFVFDPTRPAGSLDYTQNVASAYAAYTYSTESKYTFKLGARYEYTGIAATINNNQVVDIPDYGNFVPSINLSKSFNAGKYTAKAGYNRRIQRPGIQQLNPNVNAANPQSISVGNPFLEPELTDNIELGLSASIKKLYLNLSMFGRQTNNAISQVRIPLDTLQGAVLTTFQNIGQEKATGVNLFGNFSITPKWSVNGGIEAFYNYLEGFTPGLDGLSVPISNQGWNVNGRLMTMITLNKGWQVQGFSFLRGSTVQLQGRQGGFGFYSVGVRKDFANKKGSIGLAGDNFLTNGLKIRTELQSPTFSQNMLMTLLNQGVRLTFSYKIGKMGVEGMGMTRKRTKSVNNNDLKEGGGDAAQGANQGGGSGPR